MSAWRLAVTRCSAARTCEATFSSARPTSLGAARSFRISAATWRSRSWSARVLASSATTAVSRSGVLVPPAAKVSRRSASSATSSSQAARAFSIAWRRCSASE